MSPNVDEEVDAHIASLAATAVGSGRKAKTAEVRAATEDGAPQPTLDAPRAHTRRAKALVDQFYTALAGRGDGGTPAAREVVLAAAHSQSRRDQSWLRMTGFPKDVEGDIASALASRGAGA